MRKSKRIEIEKARVEQDERDFEARLRKSMVSNFEAYGWTGGIDGREVASYTFFSPLNLDKVVINNGLSGEIHYESGLKFKWNDGPDGVLYRLRRDTLKDLLSSHGWDLPSDEDDEDRSDENSQYRYPAYPFTISTWNSYQDGFRFTVIYDERGGPYSRISGAEAVKLIKHYPETLAKHCPIPSTET